MLLEDRRTDNGSLFLVVGTVIGYMQLPVICYRTTGNCSAFFGFYGLPSLFVRNETGTVVMKCGQFVAIADVLSEIVIFSTWLLVAVGNFAQMCSCVRKLC